MKESLPKLLSNRTFQVIFLVFSSLLTFLGRQLDRGITNFDGAYYAIKAREIFLSDSLWVVTWKGTAYFFDNPPLPFWLTNIWEFEKLEQDFPGEFYLIYGNKKFAYFTSLKNRENIIYDFSKMKLPVVRWVISGLFFLIGYSFQNILPVERLDHSLRKIESRLCLFSIFSNHYLLPELLMEG